MIIEYAGIADRQVGTGTVHEVRAWWQVDKEDGGKVKRAASAAVREAVGEGGTVAFESWDVDTYNTPRLNAMIRVRVRTADQVAARKELASRRYTECEGRGTDGKGCGNQPGEVVHLRESDIEQPLCYSCRKDLPAGSYQVRHWIKSGGRIQLN
jgi:hypothetical protein